MKSEMRYILENNWGSPRIKSSRGERAIIDSSIKRRWIRKLLENQEKGGRRYLMPNRLKKGSLEAGAVMTVGIIGRSLVYNIARRAARDESG